MRGRGRLHGGRSHDCMAHIRCAVGGVARLRRLLRFVVLPMRRLHVDGPRHRLVLPGRVECGLLVDTGVLLLTGLLLATALSLGIGGLQVRPASAVRGAGLIVGGVQCRSVRLSDLRPGRRRTALRRGSRRRCLCRHHSHLRRGPRPRRRGRCRHTCGGTLLRSVAGRRRGGAWAGYARRGCRARAGVIGLG